MEAAAKTWAGEWWKMGGGGSMWDGMAYDPEENLLYVGTGNGTVWSSDLRNGGRQEKQLDNLYIASILAINADTGQLKWHYQCTPGDEWDYDAIQHLLLADIRIGNRNRQPSVDRFFERHEVVAKHQFDRNLLEQLVMQLEVGQVDEFAAIAPRDILRPLQVGNRITGRADRSPVAAAYKQ